MRCTSANICPWPTLVGMWARVVKLSKVSNFSKTEYSPIPFYTQPSNNCLTFGKSLALLENVNSRDFVTLNHGMRGRVAAKNISPLPWNGERTFFSDFTRTGLLERSFAQFGKTAAYTESAYLLASVLGPPNLCLTWVGIKIQLDFAAAHI